MTTTRGVPAAWRRVLDRCTYDPASGCLLVGTGIAASGYGRAWDGKATRGTHQVTFAEMVGPIPTGMHVGHLCHDLAVIAGTCTGGPSCLHRRCVQPGHLGLQTPRENKLAGLSPTARHARVVACPAGHPYAAPHLYVDPRGRRRCRTCKAAHEAATLARWRLRARQVAPGAVWEQIALPEQETAL